ncbi:MAG TPA: carboxypeptidase-like regulatory domain-containing protein, partial [Pyrinomonadaceae bacterium]|nr:carboxypeptidase-like regulatory domain-containing protein [Pyrinomonadaceae bacterium]
MRIRSRILFLPALMFCALSVFGQTYRSTIRGTISDPNGAVVPGAAVRVVNSTTNESRGTVSDEEGAYAISSLAPGTYEVTIEAQGFQRLVLTQVALQVNQELRVDGRLQVGEVKNTVDNPYEPAPLLKKDSVSLGTVIQERQIVDLPLDGRNFYELNLLVPGAVPPAPGSAGSVRGDFAFSVNGAREDSNNFLLDGVYNVDPKLNTFAVKPPVDAIQEFESATSTYDAAFGRNPGAQVNVVLKSGTNDFHGSLYEFHRNAALDARNFFAPADEPKPKYIRNQFGFSLGGPIHRDKTFFFADYEGTRSREGQTRLATVPTLAERSGDFSQSLLGIPRNPFTGMPFDGGVIPSFFIHPVGQAIAALYPLPNRPDPLANFVSSPVQRDDNDHFDVRVDHLMSNATTLVARYSFGDRRFFEPFAGPTLSALPGFGNDVPRRSQNAMVGLTHVFSPRFVNDARFAFNRVALSVLQENQGTSINRAVGLPELSSNPRDFGLSFITITGFSPLGHEGNNPQNTVTNTFQILDTATYITGNHLFKFGVDIRTVQQNGFRDVQSRGLLNFTP